jgi:hypothetical protein
MLIYELKLNTDQQRHTPTKVKQKTRKPIIKIKPKSQKTIKYPDQCGVACSQESSQRVLYEKKRKKKSSPTNPHTLKFTNGQTKKPARANPVVI